MKMKAGFSVIECLVYCFLFSVLCFFMFDWIGVSHTSLVKIQKKSRTVLEVYAAMDSFVRDVLTAPSSITAWKKMTDTEIIWQAQEGAVGWVWDGISLYRLTGIYDDEQWKEIHKSLVSNSLARVAFVVHKNKQNEVVRIVSSFDQIKRTIMLPNRSIYDKA